MKIAVLSESPVDEAAVRVLAEGLLEVKTTVVRFPEPMRGWKSVLNSVRPALLHLHYHTDADGLIVTLDSDESPVHVSGHEELDAAKARCRLCRLRSGVSDVQAGLQSRRGRGLVKTAVGLAVPALEAWLLVGREKHMSETAWMQGLQTGRFAHTKKGLKQKVYGTDRPPLAFAEKRAIEMAQRLVEEEKLKLLEDNFPNGFGALADDVRAWKTPD